MATRKTGTIIVRAESGHKGKITIPGCTSLAAAKAFLTSIESAYMEGKGVSASASETELLTAEILGGNTDRKGVILYLDTTSATTKRISIPSWGTDAGDSSLETAGERIPLAACQSVIEALETASGRTLTALEGWVIQGR